MKGIIPFFLGLLSIGFAQSNMGLVWGPPITVANGSVYDNVRPQITLADGDIPLVTWASNVAGNKGWVSRKSGSTFDTPYKLNPTGQINAYTVEGPNIAARGDYAYAVYTKAPTNSSAIFLVRSTDAGLTWETPIWVDSLSSGIPNFANIGVLADGNPIVMYMRQTSNWANPRYVVRQSTDFGLTWQPEVPISGAAPGGLVCDCCTGQVYSNGNRIVGVFRNELSHLRDMWATVSTDGGQSFGTPVDLDSTDWVIAACPMSGPQAMFVGDSIYTVFMSQGSNGLSRVWLGASNLADSTFGWNRMLLDSVSVITQNYPTIAGNGDTMMIAWLQGNGSNAEIALRWSFSGVEGLFDNKPIYVSDWASGVQTFPDISWNNGKLHMVWQDNSNNTVVYREATVGVPTQLDLPTPNDWAIAPNPAREYFKLTNLPENGGKWQLSDLQGRLLMRGDFAGQTDIQIAINRIAQGQYFLTVTDHLARSSTKPILIRH